MKIISVSRGFTTDHSSTSYEFLAVDRPLKPDERKTVRSLSRRCRPDDRRVSFVYHAEGYDIPGGWKPLMENFYDVMYSESYDWWMLVMAFPAAEAKEELLKYEFSDHNGLGIQIYPGEKRTIVVIHCRISPVSAGDIFDEDACDAADEEEEESNPVVVGDYLLNLLVKIRRQLMAGDYRALYAVWEIYGEGENEPPKPPERKRGNRVVNEFASLLENI